MRQLFCGIVAMILTLSLAGGTVAASTDGATPATAIPLVGSPSGSSVGKGSGAFEYYTFDYPGDGSTWTLTLTFSPTNPATANAIGVNLYLAGKQIASMNGIGNPPGSHALSFSSTTAGPVLAQVYNFTPGVTVYYQLGLSGITVPLTTTTTTVAPTSTPVPTSATPAPSTSANQAGVLTGPATGSLTGNTAGSYAYYTINYFGNGTGQSVFLSFSPNSGSVAGDIYVVVYQNGSKIGSARGSDATTAGNLSTWYAPYQNGPVLVQIGNYSPGTTINYSISP